jgi:tetratricopeptide (TPR) repeat protein
VYDQANRYFFRNYLAPLALETLDEFLEKIKWHRFKNQRIATLADCWSLKAFINNSKREFSQAIESASNGLLIDPEHINSLHCRAHAYTQSGNYDQAKIDVTKALNLCIDRNKESQLKKLLATIEERLRKYKSSKPQKEIAMTPLQPSL